MYDVLATLRPTAPPYELAAGNLVRQALVATGAITSRIDRLGERGLVERRLSADDRRKVIVRLTHAGLQLVDEIVSTHLATEREILSVLSPRQQEEMTRPLRRVLLGLDDLPDAKD